MTEQEQAHLDPLWTVRVHPNYNPSDPNAPRAILDRRDIEHCWLIVQTQPGTASRARHEDMAGWPVQSLPELADVMQHPSPPALDVTDKLTELGAAIAAADLAWCRLQGDVPAEPRYWRWVAERAAELLATNGLAVQPIVRPSATDARPRSAPAKHAATVARDDRTDALEAVPQQIATLARIVGDVVGAYQRWFGWEDRASATAEEVLSELARLVIAAHVVAENLGIAAGKELDLDTAIATEIEVLRRCSDG